MEAPERCIEYILLHELCHLIHANHSARFHALVTKLMPDWKERKALLENIVINR
jgi:predicted metal-dependent hydrolase